MLGRIKKEKNREGPYSKDWRKDIIRKNKDKKGKWYLCTYNNIKYSNIFLFKWSDF